MESTFMDDVDCGSFFDHIDDLIEFPPDNECGTDLVASGDCKNFPIIWNEALCDANPLFPGSNSSASDLSAELSVPYEDIVQLEWLSTFVEDSFSGGGMTIAKDNSFVDNKIPQNQFRTSSPVSVLDSSSSNSSNSSSSSSSSSSVVKATHFTLNHCGIQRARSKRPRPTTFNPCQSIHLLAASSSISGTHTLLVSGVSSESENVGESEISKNRLEPFTVEQTKKKKKIKAKIPLGPIEMKQNNETHVVRKCLHCEITKTPQWRAGPMGPKTLCNACGVRHKSGRLFPEYRPAASPTFVPSLHSNSHRKVVEMRNKLIEKNTVVGTADSVGNLSQEEVPLGSN